MPPYLIGVVGIRPHTAKGTLYDTFSRGWIASGSTEELDVSSDHHGCSLHATSDHAQLIYLNFHPLEVVSRYRDPHHRRTVCSLR